MANQLKTGFLFAMFMLQSCTYTLDFSGFFFPDDLVDARFVQSNDWNQSHPFKTINVSSENYQLLVAADSHLGGTKNLDKLIKEAIKPENTALILVGDNVTGHKEDYDTLKTHLPDFNLKPWFLAVGNHDLYFEGWKTFYPYFGTSTYYFSIQTPTQKDLYIVLDSGSGTLGAKQLAWLQNVLVTQRTAYRNCVVFSHVNFFRNRHTGSTNPLVDELYVLMDLFAKNRINMVISGHDHVRSINEFGNTTYITMDALLDGFSRAGYLKLKTTPLKMEYEFNEVKALN